ncbi:MAG: hypothetical protein K1X28_00795 [Parachlamydiales bacterium]|nr:hypothetical protein [Parachlamydiales bacterium]
MIVDFDRKNDSLSEWTSSCLQKARNAYLRFSRPITFVLGGIVLGYNAWANLQKMDVVRAVSAAAAAAFSTFHAIYSIKQELEIPRKQKALQNLANQVNEAAQNHFPLVAILHCKDDHNGAFDALQSRFRYLKGSCRIALLPIDCKEDIEPKLQSLFDQHGVIHHAVLSGHGNEESVTFREDIFGLSMGALSSGGVHPRLFRYIDPKGTIVLDACSTGRKGGIAQKISRIAQRNVQAPNCDLDGGMGWIVHDPENGLVFLGLDEYLNSVIVNYQNGKRVLCRSLDLENLANIANRENDSSLMTYVGLCYLKQSKHAKAREAVLASFKLDMPRGVKTRVLDVQQMILDRTNPLLEEPGTIAG